MSRQAQRVHKKFYRLKLRANFFVGKSVFEKTSFCTARSVRVAGPVKFIAPWTVVRSDEYVNKKLVATKVRARSGDGHTHYVGDDCPGGHFGDHVAVGYQAGTLPAQPNNTAVGTFNTAIGPEKVLFSETRGVENHEIPAVKQPNSDNNVTGPTS